MKTSHDFVSFLYRLVLRREPDAEGLRDWTAAIEQGRDPLSVFEEFRRSEEFANQFNPYVRRPDAPLTMSPPGPGGVYFLHIPKTGGTSVKRYLERVFPPYEICPAWNWDDLAAIPRSELDRYRVFAGHLQGYLPGFVQRKLTMVTMLRDPVDRVLSSYYYIRGIPSHPFYGLATTSTLREFCLHPASRPTVEDYQTACLLTVLWGSGIERSWDFSAAFGSELPLHNAIEVTGCRGVPPATTFELAKAALDKFAAVGITEELPASLKLFSRTLGVAEVPERIHEKRTRDRLAAADLDPETRELIEDLTQADRLIYEYAKTRFASAVRGEASRDALTSQ